MGLQIQPRHPPPAPLSNAKERELYNQAKQSARLAKVEASPREILETCQEVPMSSGFPNIPVPFLGGSLLKGILFRLPYLGRYPGLGINLTLFH